jgi:hypothetical protein
MRLGIKVPSSVSLDTLIYFVGVSVGFAVTIRESSRPFVGEITFFADFCRLNCLRSAAS